MAQTSFKLNNNHRSEMTSSVIAEWEKNNPAPPNLGRLDLFHAALKELAKSDAAKRTKRMLDACKPADFNHVHKEVNFNACIRGEDGEEKTTHGYYIPLELAKEFGIPYVAETVIHDNSEIYKDYAMLDQDGNVTSKIKCVKYVDVGRHTVVLTDSSKAYAEYKRGRELRKSWEAERDSLRREVDDLLQQYNTTKQLREGWPEMASYIPARLADPASVKLPVMAASKLSQRLGIK